MRRFFRILTGIMVCPIIFLISGWVWIHFSNKEDKYCWDLLWYLISGQWEKLPD